MGYERALPRTECRYAATTSCLSPGKQPSIIESEELVTDLPSTDYRRRRLRP